MFKIIADKVECGGPVVGDDNVIDAAYFVAANAQLQRFACARAAVGCFEQDANVRTKLVLR